MMSENHVLLCGNLEKIHIERKSYFSEFEIVEKRIC